MYDDWLDKPADISFNSPHKPDAPIGELISDHAWNSDWILEECAGAAQELAEYARYRNRLRDPYTREQTMYGKLKELYAEKSLEETFQLIREHEAVTEAYLKLGETYTAISYSVELSRSHIIEVAQSALAESMIAIAQGDTELSHNICHQARTHIDTIGYACEQTIDNLLEQVDLPTYAYDDSENELSPYDSQDTEYALDDTENDSENTENLEGTQVTEGAFPHEETPYYLENSQPYETSLSDLIRSLAEEIMVELTDEEYATMDKMTAPVDPHDHPHWEVVPSPTENKVPNTSIENLSLTDIELVDSIDELAELEWENIERGYIFNTIEWDEITAPHNEIHHPHSEIDNPPTLAEHPEPPENP